jgi:hypothetical protein
MSLDSQVRQQQQCRFLEGLAFLFEINRKRQMMMEMMMDSDSDMDVYPYFESSSDDDIGFFCGGPTYDSDILNIQCEIVLFS